MPFYRRLSAVELWRMTHSPARLRDTPCKLAWCPECNSLRASLYLLSSLVITCAACLLAHGIDVTHPDRLPTPKDIARARRRFQELVPLSIPPTDPPLPEGFTLRGPGRPRKVADPDVPPAAKAKRPRKRKDTPPHNENG